MEVASGIIVSGGIVTVNGVDITEPLISNALAWYAFSLSQPELAIRERINEEAQLLNLNASTKNTLQTDGSLSVTTANTPALGGSTERTVGTNEALWSSDLSNAVWVETGDATATLTTDEAPVDGTFYSECFLNDSAADNLRQVITGLPNDVALSPSFYIKKVSESGSITFRNLASVTKGRWYIDLALVSDGDRITVDHPAVTETAAWVASATGVGSILIQPKTTGDLTFKISSVNLVQGSTVYPSIETTTAAVTEIFTGAITKGVLIEGAATQQLIYSSDYTGSDWVKAGVDLTADDSTGLGLDFTKVAQDSSTGRHSLYSATSNNISGTTETTDYFIIDRGTARYVALTSFSASGYLASVIDLETLTVTATGDTNAGASGSTDLVNLTGDYYLLALTVDGAQSSNNQFMMSHSDSGTPTLDSAGIPTFTGDGSTYFSVGHAQVEKSLYRSSPIFSSGIKEPRAADDSSISTFLNKGVLLTPNVVLGDYTTGNFDKGVGTTINTMTFYGSPSPNEGTFYGAMVADFVGAIISSNGFRVRLTAATTTHNFTYEKLDGITDQQVQDNFEYPNALTFDMSRSLYWDDVAGWITKREAGTGESGLVDDTEMWPTNNFILTMICELREGKPNVGTSTIIDAGADSQNRCDIQDRTSDDWRFLSGVGGVFDSVTHNHPASSGDTLIFEVTKDAVRGTTLEVNGSGTAKPTFTADVGYGAVATLANSAWLANASLNLRMIDVAVTPIAPIPQPIEADGMRVWLDPSDLSTLFQDAIGSSPVTSDGDPVGLILDKSGNGQHATQSNALLKPTYKTDGTYHWIEFDNTEGMNLPVGFDGDISSDNTAVSGVKVLDASWNTIFGYSYDDGIEMLLHNERTRPYVETTAGNIGGFGTEVIVDLDKVISCAWDRSAGTYKTWVDQALDVDISGTPADKKQGAVAQFGDSSSVVARFNGRIYGLTVYDTLLSDTDRNALEAYMATKSGVTL